MQSRYIICEYISLPHSRARTPRTLSELKRVNRNSIKITSPNICSLFISGRVENTYKYRSCPDRSEYVKLNAHVARSANKVWKKKRDRRWRIIYLKQYVKNNETDIRGYMRQGATRRREEGRKLDQTNRGVNSTSRRMRENDRDGKSARVGAYVCACVYANTAWRINFRDIGRWRSRTRMLRIYMSGIKRNINVNFIYQKTARGWERERWHARDTKTFISVQYIFLSRALH